MWKNIVQRSGPQMTIWHMASVAYRYLGLQIHSQIVQYLLFLHFKQSYTNQSSILRYTCFACLVTVVLDISAEGSHRTQNYYEQC